jgi:prophage regulatory protein
MAHELLRLPTVKSRTGLPRSSLYAKIAAGEFPAPIRLSKRSVAWLETEVEAWIEARIRATREAA